MSIALYHSGSLGAASHRQTLMKLVDFRLLSFHEKYVVTARNYIKQVQAVRDTSNVTIMFDSGAFTAWKRKEKDIEVRDLLARLKKAFKYCEGRFKEVFAISLDKIPGTPGTTPSAEEVREAIRISDENHHILSSELGNKVLPVFHQGEPDSRLHEVLALNPEYICVSPRNDVHEKARREWAQRTHKLIPKKVRTHGLAATGGEMLLNVPWSSVDSAAIIQAAAFGKVFIPNRNTLLLINVSKHSSFRRHYSKHYDHWPDAMVKKTLESYLNLVGVTLEDIRSEGGARELINAAVLVEASQRPHEEVPVEQGLFAL
jgi:hypothetical protein